MILKLNEDASSSKINFAKAKRYGLEYIDQQGQMEWSQSSNTIPGVSFGNTIFDKSNWDKIY